MDTKTVINTVRSMRDYIHKINLEGPQYGQAWDEIHSADHLLEALEKGEILSIKEALKDAASVAEPYLNNLAALRSAIQHILTRNPEIKEGEPSPIDCENFTKDFRHLYKSYLKDVIYPGGKNATL